MVPEFCSCRAQLPPDARFCHKCGKPQYDDFHPDDSVEEAPAASVASAASSVLPPPLPLEISFRNGTAVRVGFMVALMAVLLAFFPLPFPFVRLMLAFVAAGFFSVYLYMRRTGQRLSLRSGARLGWITGVFSFTICTVQLTASVLAASSEGSLAHVMKDMKERLPPNDAGTQQVLQWLQDPSGMAMFMLMGLFLMFILLTVLPVVGGVIGAKVLAREH